MTRFRYVGQTGSVAQLLDGTFTVTRNVGTDWAGAALADWAPGGSGWRRYVTNGHGDLVATLAADGSVSSSLRLDPWGVPLRAVPAGYPAFGFQGSLTDRSTTLVYARARWYDPVLATFTSEDPMVGDPADPPSRHLYAYAGGDPVDRADSSGLFWYKVTTRQTFAQLALAKLGKSTRWPMLWNANRAKRGSTEPTSATVINAGSCYWIPIEWLAIASERRTRWRPDACGVREPSSPADYGFGGSLSYLNSWLLDAQRTSGVGDANALFSFTRSRLYAKTDQTSNYRPRNPSTGQFRFIEATMKGLNRIAGRYISDGATPVQFVRRVWYLDNHDHPEWCEGHPCTVGNFIFLNGSDPRRAGLLAHEYIHVVQQEGRGLQVGTGSILWWLVGKGTGPTDPEEAPAYLWEAWTAMFGHLEAAPWQIWRRPPATVDPRLQ